MDVIGMVKDLKQRYNYNRRLHTMPQLAKITMDRSNTHIYRSLMARTRKHHIPVRIIFVKNRHSIYDSTVAHTTIVFTRYTFLEWLRRQENTLKTYGGLFFALCKDVQDMELSDALRSLMGLFL